MSYFGPKMNPFKMTLFVMTHQVDALSMIGFLDSKLTSHKEKTRKQKKNENFDYSIMHLGYSSKSKREGRYRENQKSWGKKQKASNFQTKEESKVLQGIVL